MAARKKAQTTKTEKKVVQEVPETKQEKFRRLANKRMPRVLKGIALIENLTSSQYEWTDEQAERIITALQNRVDNLRDRLNKTKKTEKSFQL